MSHAPPQRVYLLCGKRYSGKTTLASSMAADDPRLVVKHLADSLKLEYCQKHGLSMERMLADRSFKESHRTSIIRMGGEAREQNPDVWCEKLVSSLLPGTTDLCVADIRYPNELEFFTRWAGADACLSVRVHADDRTRAQRGWVFTEGVDDDPSETLLDDWPFQRVVETTDQYA